MAEETIIDFLYSNSRECSNSSPWQMVACKF